MKGFFDSPNAVILALLIAGVLLIAWEPWKATRPADPLRCRCSEGQNCICPPGRCPCPSPSRPMNGLQLHRWYRPTADLTWDWQTVSWRPGRGTMTLTRGTPLYVVDRRGSVAVVRGASRDIDVLVPDGDVQWFGAGTGDLGELPKDEKK